MKGFCGVSSNGLSGGLALFWDESLRVTVLDLCQRYIDVQVVDANMDVQWRATFVYGEPEWKTTMSCGSTSLVYVLFRRTLGWCVEILTKPCGSMNTYLAHQELKVRWRHFVIVYCCANLKILDFHGFHSHTIMAIMVGETSKSGLTEHVPTKHGRTCSPCLECFTQHHLVQIIAGWSLRWCRWSIISFGERPLVTK